MPADTTTVTISTSAKRVLDEIAALEGMSRRDYLETLIQYGASCAKRPGSWEAAMPFETATYTRPDTVADRWF